MEVPIPVADEEDSSAAPDPDELRRRVIPVDSTSAMTPAARAIPVAQPGSTADLENQGLQSHMQARAIPFTPAKPAPPIPGSTEDLENRSLQTFEHPKSAPIQTGVASLWTKAQNIHNPVLRVLGEIGAGGARALDTIGTMVAPRIAGAIPGTTENAYLKQQGENKQAATDAATGEKEAQTEHTKAETGAIPATVAHTQAETKALGTPKPDKPETPQQVLAGITAEDIDKGVNPSEDPRIQQVSDTITGLQKEPVQQVAPAHITYDAGIPVSVTGSDKKTYDINDPNLPAELKPLVASANRAHGTHLSEEANKTAAANTEAEKRFQEHQDALTSSTKSMIEAAPGVLSLSAKVRKLVDQQEKTLGPAASRWNEFMAGKVGAPNPDFTRLRTDVGLLTTKLMRMHVGARGGEMIMQHFKDLIDTGKQSPANLRAALDEIDDYAKETAAERPGVNKQDQSSKGGPKVGDVEGGHKFKGGDPADKNNWEKVAK